MLQVNNLVGFGAGGAAADAAISYTDSSLDPGNSSDYTFSSAGIGTASSDRYIAVALAGRQASGTPGLSSLTVGGQSCSELIIENSTTQWSAIWITDSPVTSGTTADIVATCNDAQGRLSFGVWALTSLRDSGTAKGTDTDASASAITLEPTTESGAVVIAVAYLSNSGGVVWTGVTERYEDYEGTRGASGGEAGPTGATITITGGSVSGTPKACAATFR